MVHAGRWALVALVVLASVYGLGSVYGRNPTATHHPAPVPADAFVTVTSGSPHVGQAVQLRSLPHGTLVRRLVQAKPGTEVSAAQMAGGDVLVAANTRCTTVLERVDPGTDRITKLRTIRETVADIAVSPDGSHLAYLTHPSCRIYYCPTECAGPAMFAPNVLVVLDLRTGRSSRTATDMPGHPLIGLSWSPDGRRIVADYWGNRHQLLIFDRDHPDFATATRVDNPSGCSYLAPSWTVAGLIAPCGSNPPFSPLTLVRLSAAGTVTARWSLPRCIDGVSTRTNPAHERLLIQVNIGYGSGTCGRNWGTRIFQAVGGNLRTVLAIPGNSKPIRLDG